MGFSEGFTWGAEEGTKEGEGSSESERVVEGRLKGNSIGLSELRRINRGRISPGGPRRGEGERLSQFMKGVEDGWL